MITGRGPGAPGVPPGLEFTRRRATADGTGGRAVDLGEIRRSEEAINVLAARGAAGPELAHDPALVMLAALAADVDTPGARPREAQPGGSGPGEAGSGEAGPGEAGPGEAGPGEAGPAWPGRAVQQRAAAWQALAGRPSRGAAAWLRAGAAGGVAAGLASITSLIATSMLARLARGPARGGRYGRHARPRRGR